MRQSDRWGGAKATPPPLSLYLRMNSPHLHPSSLGPAPQTILELLACRKKHGINAKSEVGPQGAALM